MSETGNGRKNWTRVVAAVGLVFLAVAGGIVLANANKVINKTEKKVISLLIENSLYTFGEIALKIVLTKRTIEQIGSKCIG